MNGMESIRQSARRAAQGLWALSLLSGPLLAGDPQPQELWADQRVQEPYYDYVVSLGNNGTQIFTDTGFVDTYRRLYSAFRDSTAAPVWEATLPNEQSYKRSVSSAKSADVHAVVRHQGSSSAVRHARLEILTSNSSAPIFAHDFTETGSSIGSNWCHVSDDGKSVIACHMTLLVAHVKRFDAQGATFVQNGDWLLQTHGEATSVGISEDLRHIYLGSNAAGKIFDLSSAQGTEIFYEWYIGGASKEGQAFSKDGLRIAVPLLERVDLYERQGPGYVLSNSFAAYSAGSSWVARRAALSGDGRILTAAYYLAPDVHQATVVAWDLVSGQQLLQDTVTGQLQNYPQDLVISEDGRRIAVAYGGAEPGAVPGMRVYASQGAGSSFVTLATFDRPGAVVDLDLSPDGSRLAAAGKAVPLGSGWGDRIVETIDLGRDLDLRGVPRRSTPVTFEYYPSSGAGSYCWLLEAASLEPTPVGFSFGTLYVRRSQIEMISMGVSDAMGKATYPLTIPSSAVIGSTLYYQGFAIPPRQLSKSWIPVTVLPN
jgi:hypothetical protein